MSDAPKRSDEPTDRLTRICAVMTDEFDAHPEIAEGDRCVVFISSDRDRKNGLVIHGYDSDTAAVADVLLHLRAILRANGKDMHIVPIGGTPEGKRE